MLTLYWIPRTGDPEPRLVAFDDKERKYQVTGVKVKEYKGALKYTMPDNLSNRNRMDNAKAPWHIELPNKVQKDIAKSVDEVESSPEDSILKTTLTREELIETLENNGIPYKKNHKTKTLFEKLPDDIARNFQLVESSVEVQT